MTQRTLMIGADHGLAVLYFLQTDVIPTLLDAGVRVVFLTDPSLHGEIEKRYGRSGLVLEDLRLKEAGDFYKQKNNNAQFWLDFFRRAGASQKMNLETVNNYLNWTKTDARGSRKTFFPLVEGAVGLMRLSKAARQSLVRMQKRFTPHLYDDLFELHRPNLVIASTPGWRLDRYLLRDAAAAHIPTGAIVLGWDNPSSHALSGAPVQWISCWSEAQRQELIDGSDWQPGQINIGGIPSYDGYFRKEWLMTREEYFRLHGLEPERKLLAYACSFVTYSPNIQNIEALARLISENRLPEPAQLLVRLHPNHFTKEERWAREREQVFSLAQQHPHMHIVEPVPLGESYGYYSGEDMPEKSSMMQHADIFLTVYSTMVVETSIHDTPIISVTIDSPDGWPGRYSLPLTQIGRWPTHSRFREAKAGLVAENESQLEEAICFYLQNPQAHAENRRLFVKQECTYTDGRAGRRTAEYWLTRLNGRTD